MIYWLFGAVFSPFVYRRKVFEHDPGRHKFGKHHNVHYETPYKAKTPE